MPEEVVTIEPGTIYRLQLTLPKGDKWPSDWRERLAYWLRQKGSAVKQVKVHYGPIALRDFFDPRKGHVVTWWIVDVSFDAPFLAYWLEEALSASLDSWVDVKSVAVSSGIKFPQPPSLEQIGEALKLTFAAIFLLQVAQLGINTFQLLRKEDSSGKEKTPITA